MKILLLGSGGREHALASKIVESRYCDSLFVAPGNAGTCSIAHNVAISPADFDAVGRFALHEQIDMLVVGPEEPLVRGIYDYFQSQPLLSDIAVIGPSSKGAQLEGSKQFAKEFMQRYHIPTARYGAFTLDTFDEGFSFLQSLQPPYVLKADGLAAGKGVVILPNLMDAQRELREMLQGKYGQASQTVVIEEFLNGIECSVFVLTDGSSYKILPSAKDYKRIGDNDTGANTGGMGAVSPVWFCDHSFMKKVEDKIVKPTVSGLKAEKIDYRGFIFLGLMNVGGNPFVIEYNVRMGDPETEVVMPRIKSDLVELFKAVADGTLHEKNLLIDPQYAITVVVASGGYPAAYRKGMVISGLDTLDNCTVFHAGTAISDRQTVTCGGRVLAVTALAPSLQQAQAIAYQNVAKIDFDNKYSRTDIGNDLKTNTFQ